MFMKKYCEKMNTWQKWPTLSQKSLRRTLSSVLRLLNAWEQATELFWTSVSSSAQWEEWLSFLYSELFLRRKWVTGYNTRKHQLHQYQWHSRHEVSEVLKSMLSNAYHTNPSYLLAAEAAWFCTAKNTDELTILQTGKNKGIQKIVFPQYRRGEKTA